MKKKYIINDMEKCNEFLTRCREQGWRCWQMQYRATDPEGFHAWFIKSGKQDIEILSYNEEVQKAIVNFEP